MPYAPYNFLSIYHFFVSTGGTVDITVHEVRSDKSLKEIHRASGGPWGGIKVDDAFQEYLLELFGFEIIESLAKNEVIELERNPSRERLTLVVQCIICNYLYLYADQHHLAH